jgi:hypothetical protein
MMEKAFSHKQSNERLTQGTTGVNPENIMLSAKRQKKDHISHESTVHKDRKPSNNYQGLRGGDNYQGLLNEHRVSLRDKNILALDRNDGCKHCECTNAAIKWLMVDFVMYEYYLISKKQKAHITEKKIQNCHYLQMK